MKVIAVLAIILVILVLVNAARMCIRSWHMSHTPWHYEEEESLDGLQWRVKAVKPGHERILTDWHWTKNYGELDGYIVRQEANENIIEMNGTRKQIG
jgi:hypothetical protein